MTNLCLLRGPLLSWIIPLSLSVYAPDAHAYII